MDQSCYRFGTWFGGDLGFFPFTKLNINDMRRILRGSDSKSVGQNHHVADTKRSRTSQKEALEWHVESKNEISCVHFIYQSICLTPRPFSKKKKIPLTRQACPLHTPKRPSWHTMVARSKNTTHAIWKMHLETYEMI
jgi:hypothetical protein